VRFRIINNKLAASCVFTLLLVITTAVPADSGYSSQLPQYSSQVAAGSSYSRNRWAPPEKPEATVGFMRFPGYSQKPYQQRNKDIDRQYKDKSFTGGRFVTPQILERLKQQQTRNQQVPRYQRNERYLPSSPTSESNKSLIQGTDDYPSCDVGNVNSLYDISTVSPWGSGPDVIYRGESFPDTYSNSIPGAYTGVFPNASPWGPSAVVGGTAPMNAPIYEYDHYSGEIKGFDDQNKTYRWQNNAFKPFGFMP
jgi:hypothetical protein